MVTIAYSWLILWHSSHEKFVMGYIVVALKTFRQKYYDQKNFSYKNFPSNLEVIDWLGSYFIEMQVVIIFFKKKSWSRG